MSIKEFCLENNIFPGLSKKLTKYLEKMVNLPSTCLLLLFIFPVKKEIFVIETISSGITKIINCFTKEVKFRHQRTF